MTIAVKVLLFDFLVKGCGTRTIYYLALFYLLAILTCCLRNGLYLSLQASILDFQLFILCLENIDSLLRVEKLVPKFQM